MNRSPTSRRRRALAALAGLALLVPRAAAQDQDQGQEQSFERALVDLLKERGILDDAEGEELLRLARERARRNTAEMDLIEGHLEKMKAPEVSTHGGKPGDLEFRSANGKWSLGIKGRI